MATKSVAKVEEPVTNLPAEQYDYGQYAGVGQDQIDNADVSIPRLKVIQAMSPEAKDELAKEGDLLHSITKEVLVPKGGKTPVIPILYQKEYILWRDRKSGGGIMARARKVLVTGGVVKYAWDQPDTVFEDKLDGKLAVKYKTAKYIEDDGLHLWGSQIPGDADSGPAATETHNFIVALEEFDYQLIALSLSRTSTKKAKDLNFMIKTAMNGGAPMFALRFNIGTTIESGDGNTWANVAFSPAGKIAPNDPKFLMLADLYKGFQTKSFTIDQEQEESKPSSSEAPF
jgi:hypothetical protein